MKPDTTQNHVFTGVFIPVKIWLHPDFTPVEKMMLAEIKALEEETGWCYAGNAHFAKWLKCSPQNVSNYVSNFKKQGLIDVKFSDEKTHSGRKMRVNLAWYRSIQNPLSPAVPPLSPAVTDIHFKDTSKPSLEGEREVEKNTPTIEDVIEEIKNQNSALEAKKEKAPPVAPPPPSIFSGFDEVMNYLEFVDPCIFKDDPTHIVHGVDCQTLPGSIIQTAEILPPPNATDALLTRLKITPKAENAIQAGAIIAKWCEQEIETVKLAYENARRKYTPEDLNALIIKFCASYSNNEKIGKQLLFFADPARVFLNGLTKWLHTQNDFDREQGAKAQKAPYQQPEQKYVAPQKPTPPQAYYD